jgi:hypothetical protein
LAEPGLNQLLPSIIGIVEGKRLPKGTLYSEQALRP